MYLFDLFICLFLFSSYWQVQSVAMTYWTTEVHNAIMSGLDAMQKYLEMCNIQISKIVDLVRGRLSTQNRITLGVITGWFIDDNN